jgi:hypothetical protein
MVISSEHDLATALFDVLVRSSHWMCTTVAILDVTELGCQ